jgi:hypothetical protein
MEDLKDHQSEGYKAAKKHFDDEDRARIDGIIQCRATLAAAAAKPAPATGGTLRTVSENTDLYDAREGNKIGGENDFLRAGQQVTTVGQCGADWCELSNPKAWVWGGHLK